MKLVDKNYNIEIFKMCQEIIEKKNYKLLAQILVTYDSMVKKENNIKDEEKPYWCRKEWWGK